MMDIKIYILFVVLILLILGILISSRDPPGSKRMNAEKENSDSKYAGKEIIYEHYIYPVSYHIYRVLRRFIGFKRESNRCNSLKKIKIVKSSEDIKEEYYCKIISGIYVSILIIVIAFICVNLKNKDIVLFDNYFIERNEPGDGSFNLDIYKSYENNDIKTDKEEISIEIPSREYSDKEKDKIISSAKEYLNKTILGDNDSLDSVTEPLNLIDKIPDVGINVKYKIEPDGYIESDGSLNNYFEEDFQLVVITAVLEGQGISENVVYNLKLLKREKSADKILEEEYEDELNSALKKDPEKKWIKLPESVGNLKVKYEEVENKDELYVILVGIVLIIMIPVFINNRIDEEFKKRNTELILKYPELINKISLFVGAGLSIRGAWEQIIKEYEKSDEKSFLYEEISATGNEMENGVSESDAYIKFGNRIGLLCYLKFSALLVQNLKKGSDDLLRLMDMEASDAFIKRKEQARILGEEAGTKLLLPMFIMFTVVIVIIMFSAFQSM